jgi:hypothetical protein
MKASPFAALALALIALCQAAPAAHAQERVSPETAATPTSARDTETPPDLGTPDTPHAGWYGWQTLMADAGSIGLMFLGGANGEAFPVVLGAVGYVAVTPAILSSHGNDAWTSSALLRLAVPTLMFAGAVIAFSGCPLFDEESSCDRTPGVVVMGAGLVLGAAMPIVDAVRAVDRQPSRSAHRGIAIAPWLTPHADAAGVAVSGRL